MSFYRKYRPQVIEEIDNVAVRDQLLSLLSKDKKELPHAYLFSGPRGAGKTTAARLIAKMLNCEKPTKNGPCGKCEQCTSIATGRNLDVLEIDAASNRGIDEIRMLRDAINLSPSSAPYKVYIIDEVHMLTTEAFNALLKTLEEPPVHAVFVLATTDPQKVPVTIKSRCVNMVFHRASAQELLNALARIVKDEKLAIDADGLQVIAESVDGSFRDAVKFLEQVSFHKGKLTADVVRHELQLSESATVTSFISVLAAKDARGAMNLIAKLVSDGNDIKTFLTDCLAHLEKQLVGIAQGKPESALSPSDIRDLIRRLTNAFGEMKISPIAQLPLELVVVEYCENENSSSVIPTKPLGRVEGSVTHTSQAPQQSGDSSTPALPAGGPLGMTKNDPPSVSSGLLTLEKLIEHWPDVIATLKPFNHSIAGVLRSTRPKAVEGGIVTIEAFYTFHKEKLSESKTKDILSDVLKKLFGEKVKVEVVLGKK